MGRQPAPPPGRGPPLRAGKTRSGRWRQGWRGPQRRRVVAWLAVSIVFGIATLCALPPALLDHDRFAAPGTVDIEGARSAGVYFYIDGSGRPDGNSMGFELRESEELPSESHTITSSNAELLSSCRVAGKDAATLPVENTPEGRYRIQVPSYGFVQCAVHLVRRDLSGWSASTPRVTLQGRDSVCLAVVSSMSGFSEGAIVTARPGPVHEPTDRLFWTARTNTTQTDRTSCYLPGYLMRMPNLDFPKVQDDV